MININAVRLTHEEFKLISSLVYDRFGIKLSDQKRDLVTGRLLKDLFSGGFNSFKDYYNHIIKDHTGQALLKLVDRISTNYTYFFRESEHFEYFAARALPRMENKMSKMGEKGIRVWCAGCSSGEEPYTLAIVSSEQLGVENAAREVSILATDISVTALDEAKAGIYSKEKISKVPPLYRQAYFYPLINGRWHLRRNLKDMVLFRRLNLMRREYPFKGLFQAIFCRNVMIYFDKATQDELIERFHRYTEPGGYLFVGHSETIDRFSGLYKYIRPSIYQKV